jgi:cytidyltransferase-like protein
MDKKFVIVSGGFDPIHSGHVRLISDASKFGPVIVIINSDDFLIEKKGYAFMNVKERVHIIKNIKNVSEVFISIDNDHTVSKTIEFISSNLKYNIGFFANGGDRKDKTDVPEWSICNKHNIELLFDIGGSKTQSSSNLVESVHDKMLIKEGHFQITQKPWGYYKSFISEDEYLLKKIVVYKNEELSLQSHKLRDEHWVVVSGSINVQVNKIKKTLNIGEHIFVPKGTVHKIINYGGVVATIIEIQFGSILAEGDIKRISDKYNR